MTLRNPETPSTAANLDLDLDLDLDRAIFHQRRLVFARRQALHAAERDLARLESVQAKIRTQTQTQTQKDSTP